MSSLSEDEARPGGHLPAFARKDLSGGKGIHKTTWTFTYEGLLPQSPRTGPMVAPGTYTVAAYKFADGKAESLGAPTEFKVESIVQPTLPMQDRTEVIAFIKEMGLYVNKTYAASQQLIERVDHIT